MNKTMKSTEGKGIKDIILNLKVNITKEDNQLAYRIWLSNQTKLAKTIGCTRPYLSHCIHGDYPMSEKFYKRIIKYFEKL